MFAAILPILGSIGARVAASLFPDPADKLKAQELENKLTSEILASAAAMEQAAAGIVKAEAQSQHWLAANWRPLTMLTFVGLIVARWFGWSAPGLSEAEALALWDIVELGLGGYVIGRSVEKIAPGIVGALKK
jgi:hypothetical protein